MQHAYKMTLADEIATGMAKNEPLESVEWSKKTTGEATRYNIQSVYDFVRERGCPAIESSDLELLPHPVVWLEWEVDHRKIFRNESAFSKIGVVCVEIEHTKRELVLFMNSWKCQGPSTMGICTTKKIIESDEWYSEFASFKELPPELRNEENIKMLQEELQNLFAVAAFAIKLLNCKNVTTTTKEPPTTINERRIREKKPPFTSYKVLNLPIGKERSPSTHGADKNAGMTRLHIARGHFKTYTEEKPLLGRAVGTYWWPQVLKGKKENGQIIKDYKITMPPAKPNQSKEVS